MEDTGGVLESPVTLGQRRCAGVGRYSQIKGVKYKLVVVSVPDHVGNDLAVIQVEDDAEIDLVDLNPVIPLELRYVRQPLLIGLFGLKVAVQKVLGNELWVLVLPGTAVVGIFNIGIIPNINNPSYRRLYLIQGITSFLLSFVMFGSGVTNPS